MPIDILYHIVFKRVYLLARFCDNLAFLRIVRSIQDLYMIISCISLICIPRNAAGENPSRSKLLRAITRLEIKWRNSSAFRRMQTNRWSSMLLQVLCIILLVCIDVHTRWLYCFRIAIMAETSFSKIASFRKLQCNNTVCIIVCMYYHKTVSTDMCLLGVIIC